MDTCHAYLAGASDACQEGVKLCNSPLPNDGEFHCRERLISCEVCSLATAVSECDLGSSVTMLRRISYHVHARAVVRIWNGRWVTRCWCIVRTRNPQHYSTRRILPSLLLREAVRHGRDAPYFPVLNEVTCIETRHRAARRPPSRSPNAGTGSSSLVHAQARSRSVPSPAQGAYGAKVCPKSSTVSLQSRNVTVVCSQRGLGEETHLYCFESVVTVNLLIGPSDCQEASRRIALQGEKGKAVGDIAMQSPRLLTAPRDAQTCSLFERQLGHASTVLDSNYFLSALIRHRSGESQRSPSGRTRADFGGQGPMGVAAATSALRRREGWTSPGECAGDITPGLVGCGRESLRHISAAFRHSRAATA